MIDDLKWMGLVVVLLVAPALICAAGCDDPGDSERVPLIRYGQEDECSSGERGNLMITEINYAGSVDDDGTRDADDIFVELQNKHPRPINPSRWHLFVEGDVENSYRIPRVEEPIEPNGYFVIARKRDGAFASVAEEKGAFIEKLELGTRRVELELRDCDLRLMESAGSSDQEVFTGGWDTVSTRSMERAELIFGNSGNDPRNWHAFSQQEGHESIEEGWRDFTLSSPGEANSADYSGSSTSGNYE